MKKNGYTIVELSIVLGVFSICYFTAAWLISGKLNVNYEEQMYEDKLTTIENGAVYYAKTHENLFEKENVAYITVEDLAKSNIVRSQDNYEVIDPRDNDSTMNNIKIKLTNENEKITAKILS